MPMHRLSSIDIFLVSAFSAFSILCVNAGGVGALFTAMKYQMNFVTQPVFSGRHTGNVPIGFLPHADGFI